MSSTALLLKIGADASALKAELDKAKQQLEGFTGTMKGIGNTISGVLGAAAASEVLKFTFEVSKLAAEAQGVQNAFNKIPNSVQLMADLKKATAGTVSELDLMKRAVSFKNFNLDLAQMPKLLEFATLRAQQTGQSVDYLVDSIVTGLGRKSVMILDNLGISASALSAEVEKTGDFVGAVGNIVDVELTKMGGHLENNLTKTERFNASWTNLKVTMGEAANGTGLLGRALDDLTESVDIAASKNLSFWQKLAAMVGGPGVRAGAIIADQAANLKKLAEEAKKNEQITREVDRAYVEFNKNIDAYGKAIATHQYRTELLAEFTKRLKDEEDKRAGTIENIKNLTAELTSKQEMQQVLTGKALATTNAEIKALEEKIKKLRELGTLQSGKGPAAAVVAPPPITFDPNEADKLFKSPISDKEMEDIMQSIDDSVSQMEAETAPKLERFKYVWIDLADTIRMSMADAAVGLAEGIADMATGVGSMQDIGRGLIAAVASFMGNLGRQMIQLGIAKAILDKLSVGLPGGALIAAGAALVAASRAVSNSLNGGVAGGGRGSSGASGNVTQNMRSTNVQLDGKFKIEGRDLVLAYNKNSKLDTQRKGG